MANVLRDRADRYAGASIALHWLMLALLVAVYASIELRELFPKGSEPRDALKALHYSLGLTALGLALLRLAVRALAGPAPRIVPSPSRWEARAATAMHIALYALILGLPLAGWATLSAAGEPVRLFGVALPPLLGADEAVGERLEELHEAAAIVGYFLIAAHAGAALFHHYLRHDNALRRMLISAGR